MTRKERIFAAIRGEPVDCTPHCTYNIHPYARSMHRCDSSYEEILAQIEATSGAAIKVGVGDGSGIPAELYEMRTTGSGDARVDHTTLHTPKGDLHSETRAPENKPAMTTRHLLADDGDIEKFLSLPWAPEEIDFTALRQTYEAAADHAMIFACYGEPLYSTASLFDFEDFTVRCITDLPSIKRIADWFFERQIDHVRRIAEAHRGMDLVLHTSGPEVCSPPMLPPALFAELVAPYMKQIIRVIHDAGLLACIHCHGRVREVLSYIMDTGCDLLEPLEPPDQGDIALAELMAQTQGRMSLMGYIQDQEFYTAPPGRMTARVEEIARVVGGRTGYIMSPTCTPFDHPCTDIYRRNYLEWLRAAERIFWA